MANNKKRTNVNTNAPALKGAPVIPREQEVVADIAIIGAGAAGLAAACSACVNRPGVKLVVVDRNNSAGKKIRATGNGRCNISNEAAEGREEVLKFLESVGISVKSSGDKGLMYPRSESAADVADALSDRVLSLGGRILLNSEVASVEKENSFVIKGRNESGHFTVKAARLILAAGGKAGPAYGTTGDAYKWMTAFGHRIVRPIPILTPIECQCDNCEDISGIRAKAQVKLYQRGELVFRESGEVQFTRFGISGICVFNATRYMRFDREAGISIFEIGLDLFEDEDVESVLTARLEAERRLAMTSGYKVPAAGVILRTLVKDKLAAYVMKRAGIDESKPVLELGNDEIHALAGCLKDLRFHPSGIKGWKEAQCTSGGVDLEEVDEDTYESRIVSGMYIAGELLDYDGPCGGYNLNNAFLTGKRAGENAARGV